MGYRVEASLIYGIPADEVPQQWLDDNGCEDASEVWLEYSGDCFTCHTHGYDMDCTNYIGYVISSVELDSADEIDNVGEIERAISALDPTPFNEMSAYDVVRPRLFLICSYL